MTKRESRRLLYDTIVLMGANTLNFGSGFITALFVGHFLGLNALGEFSLILAIIPLVTLISDFGLSTVLVRTFVSRKYRPNDILGEINRFKTLATAILSAAILLLVSLFWDEAPWLGLLTALLSALPRGMFATYEAALRAMGHQRVPATIRSVTAGLQVALTFIFLSHQASLIGLFAIMLLTESMAFALGVLAYNRFPSTLEPSGSSQPLQRADLLREAQPVFINNVLELSMPRITTLLVGAVGSATALGIYSVATRFSNLVALPAGALCNSFFATIAATEHGNAQRIEVTTSTLRYAFLTGIAITVVLFALADLAIAFTFQVSEATPLLRILALTALPIMVSSVLSGFLYAECKERLLRRVFFGWWVLNLLGGTVALSLFGLLGLAVLTVVLEYSFMTVLLGLFIRIRSALPNDSLRGNEQFHDQIAGSYDAIQSRLPYVSIIRRRFHDLLRASYRPGSVLLELGCGTGADSIAAAHMGFRLTAVDISMGMLDAARQKAETAGMTERILFEKADINDLNHLKEFRYDGIISNFDAVNYVTDLKRFAADAAELVRPGGFVIVTLLNRFHPLDVVARCLRGDFRGAFRSAFDRRSVLLTHLSVFSPRQFCRHFKRDFDIIGIDGIGIVVPPDDHNWLYRKLGVHRERLRRYEQRCGSMFPFFNLADQCIVTMRRKSVTDSMCVTPTEHCLPV